MDILAFWVAVGSLALSLVAFSAHLISWWEKRSLEKKVDNLKDAIDDDVDAHLLAADSLTKAKKEIIVLKDVLEEELRKEPKGDHLC